MGKWSVTGFHKHPGRKDFSCSEPALNDYLSRYAGQHEQAGIARTFLATAADTDELVGYYSLSMGSIPRDNLPDSQKKRFPTFPVPVARLARLAVDQKYQGQGVGEFLFMAALEQCHQLSVGIGMAAVVVDAKHEQAAQFYQRYGFESLPDQPLLLWLPIKKIARLFE